jgi:hypothetical protein
VRFFKAYLEFDEEGRAFDPEQGRAITQKLEEMKATKHPVYVVTYIHGWHHNALITDDTTTDFVKFDYFMARYTELTRRLYEVNGNYKAPIVLGIYVGWRGESMTLQPFNKLTIGSRAAAADRMARHRNHDSLHHALTLISNKMRETGEDSRMLVLGHSLGGRMVSRMFIPEIANGNTQPLGKGVLLAAVEPAISADCYDGIFKRGDRIGDSNLPPSFISVTSEKDDALSAWYERAGYAPPGVAPPACSYSGAWAHTIGNHVPYVTHDLKYENFGEIERNKPKKGSRNPFQADGKTLIHPLAGEDPNWLFNEGTLFWRYPYYNGCDGKPNDCYDTWDATFYTTTLTHKKAKPLAGAVWNIRTDSNVIDAREGSDAQNGLHNGYVSSGLTDFLVHVTYFAKKWTLPSSTLRR